MQKESFHFSLPPELIAQYPLKSRTASRLLVYDKTSGCYKDTQFSELTTFLRPNDLLVMNNSRVLKARLLGHKETGGKVECLVERILSAESFLAMLKSSKRIKPGSKILLSVDWQITILEKKENFYLCRTNGKVNDMLDDIGHIPLPPYITRTDEQLDSARYQTVYARDKGSVAAPTAGLHFDESLMSELKEQGINIAFTTLHVGAGTFKPVRCQDIRNHEMHAERYCIDETLVRSINDTRAKGGRVIAVGTTALRSLESAAKRGGLVAHEGETNIFIYPGYTFKLCDGLITNFHLPESTLIMLVAAFIGHQETLDLYQYAIDKKYRFFSYGDACLLL